MVCGEVASMKADMLRTPLKRNRPNEEGRWDEILEAEFMLQVLYKIQFFCNAALRRSLMYAHEFSQPLIDGFKQRQRSSDSRNYLGRPYFPPQRLGWTLGWRNGAISARGRHTRKPPQLFALVYSANLSGYQVCGGSHRPAWLWAHGLGLSDEFRQRQQPASVRGLLAANSSQIEIVFRMTSTKKPS